MSEYQPIIPAEEPGPYLRRVFLSKMPAHSPQWWALGSAIDRVEQGQRLPPPRDTYEATLSRLHHRIRELEAEICVLKNAKEEPVT
tara:strand:+ start:129 stop:386 length:258 start_codon:yes stop_codon:yes gene_type:complete